MMNDLRTAAVAAYKEYSARSLENQLAHNARVQERVQNFFDEAFGMFPDSVAVGNDGELVTVTAGDLNLQFEDDSFFLMGVCPDCGQEVQGYRVYNLESLGAAIAGGFAPNHRHNCGTMVALPEMNDVQAAIDHLDHGIGLADMAGRNFPDTPHDAAVLGQLRALIAIALELRRANDRNDCQQLVSFRDPTPAERDYANSLVPRAEKYLNRPMGDAEAVDPFMPPDGFWQWMPDAKCVAVDGGGGVFWYDADIKAGEVSWSTVGISLMDAGFGCLGNRDLGDTDWRTTKRTRPPHL